MRNTFSSSFRDMTYDQYLEQSMAMCENRLHQILSGNSNLMNSLDGGVDNPSVRKNSNIPFKIQ